MRDGLLEILRENKMIDGEDGKCHVSSHTPGTILPAHSAQVSELTLEWWNGPKGIIEGKKKCDYGFSVCFVHSKAKSHVAFFL